MALNLSGTTGIVTGNIAALQVTTATIADNNVTTAKILNANVTPAKLSQPLTLETAKAYNWNGLTTNTSLDFTGIPSWAKRITVMLNGVSTNGASLLQIQTGSGSIQTSGYSGYYYLSNTLKGSFSSAFIIVAQSTAASVNYGSATLHLIGSNTWVETGIVADPGYALAVTQNGGAIALSGSLDRIRLTTANGTDTFDAGSVNILYEG